MAPLGRGSVPQLYKTESDLLIPEDEYVAWGSGKPIADYLAGQLFRWDRLDKVALATLVAFIIREAERSSPGVGLGADMIFIHDVGEGRHHFHKDSVKEIQDAIPILADVVYPYWKEHVKVPAWIVG